MMNIELLFRGCIRDHAATYASAVNQFRIKVLGGGQDGRGALVPALNGLIDSVTRKFDLEKNYTISAPAVALYSMIRISAINNRLDDAAGAFVHCLFAKRSIRDSAALAMPAGQMLCGNYEEGSSDATDETQIAKCSIAEALHSSNGAPRELLVIVGDVDPVLLKLAEDQQRACPMAVFPVSKFHASTDLGMSLSGVGVRVHGTIYYKEPWSKDHLCYKIFHMGLDMGMIKTDANQPEGMYSRKQLYVIVLKIGRWSQGRNHLLWGQPLHFVDQSTWEVFGTPQGVQDIIDMQHRPEFEGLDLRIAQPGDTSKGGFVETLGSSTSTFRQFRAQPGVEAAQRRAIETNLWLCTLCNKVATYRTKGGGAPSTKSQCKKCGRTCPLWAPAPEPTERAAR